MYPEATPRDAYRNRPLSGVMRGVLFSLALLVADVFFCIMAQAFVDHVLHSHNIFIAPAAAHLLSGFLLWLPLRMRADTPQEVHVGTILLAWIMTAPIAFFIGLGIGFFYHFVF